MAFNGEIFVFVTRLWKFI